MLSSAETERIEALLREFDLYEVRDLILQRAYPMIMIGLKDLSAREQREPLDKMPIGASRWGGSPDVPKDFVWPDSLAGNPMHFVMQLDLASAPSLSNSPLPSFGRLYVFADMDGDDYSINSKILFSDVDQKYLSRLPSPPGRSEDLFLEYFPPEFEPFLLTTSLGIEILYEDAQRINSIDLILERLPQLNSEELTDRYLVFIERAADVRYKELANSGYPLHWWRVGQLFGYTNSRHQKESAKRYLERVGDAGGDISAEAARWHRLVSLDSNSVVGFESLCDARPYRFLVREPSQVPWKVFEDIQSHIEMG